jgi:hypothetical protein
LEDRRIRNWKREQKRGRLQKTIRGDRGEEAAGEKTIWRTSKECSG